MKIRLPLAMGLSLLALSCAAQPSNAPPQKAPAKEPPDTCGAKALQGLVGKPKSQIPAKPAGAVWRVTCSTCVVTQDYSPARLNIIFDEKTGIVKEVKCG